MQEFDKEPVQQEYLFALDIGTRSVIGIVGKQQHGVFHVIDTEYAEHDKRAMFDGQIEDIDQVARVSGLVKQRLEARLGVTFGNVCVAAAGRALRTSRSGFQTELDPEEPISTQQVYQLEMGAIGIAQDEVNSAAADEENQPGLFCVGYSVVGYWLDDYQMTTVLGHKGRTARVEVLATFLPNQVVDSLRSAMSLIDLNIINLTLEPIAAMNAVIPAELRLLNLALVDIGAGTSDIAISDKGSVVAYTMATTAGDEITEALMKRYLIDFRAAEQLKAAAGTGSDPIAYTDILGFAYTLTRDELLEALRAPVETLAEEICNRIVQCNGGAPVAIFLVGGGSKVQLLPDAVAKRLDIARSKVAVGGSAYMKKQTSGELDCDDPEYATPLGIAITAASYAEQNSMYVYVNDQKVYLLRSSGFTVMNALLMCGYKYHQLMGKSGRTISFTLNGENIMVRGGLPKAAEITVNDKTASLATAVECGDRIIIMPSLSGVDALPKAGDFAKTSEEPAITMDGIPYAFGELLLVNDQQVSRSQPIEDGDRVQTIWVNSLGQLCTHNHILTDGRQFRLNGSAALATDLLRDGDQLVSEDEDYEFPTPAAQPEEPPAEAVPQTEPLTAPQFASWLMDEVPAPPAPLPAAPAAPQGLPVMTVTLNQRTVELTAKEDKMPYLFLDMLNLVDIDPTKPEGDIVLRVNGQNASYLQEIHPGDSVQIYWAERGMPLT